MRNLHTLIVGQTGAGKTTLAKALLARTARAIVLDREAEYEIDGALVAWTFDEAVQMFLANRHGAFTLVYRGEDSGDHVRLVELAEHSQLTEPHGPLVIVLEEASDFSTTFGIEEVFHRLYNKGRRRRISLLTIIQVDTDIHRVTRHNSKVIATVYQSKLSSDLRNYFSLEDVRGLTSLYDEYTDTPEQGRHFLVMPEGMDLYRVWIKEHGYILADTGDLSSMDTPDDFDDGEDE